MRFTALFALLPAVWAIPDPRHLHQRQDSIDWASLYDSLQNFSLPTNITAASLPTINIGNLSPPPRSLIPEILSAVPASVLWQLANPDQRASLSSEFSAGSTPSWYYAIPTDVRNYLSEVKSEISAGALTATTGLADSTPGATATGSASATGTAAATSSSSQAAAAGLAQPTGMTLIGGMGALGVLGVALAL